MHLTTYSDYALRVLIYLAAFPEKLASTEEISRAYGISHHHLVKVVNALGKKGFLEIRRGRNGGIRLGREPQSINLGQVVRSMEPEFHLAECFNSRSDTCPLTPSCQLRGVLNEALNSFFGVLDRHTLDSIVGKSRERTYRNLLSNRSKSISSRS